jgi:hypothetical protein
MMELRIRACHVQGQFRCDNRAAGHLDPHALGEAGRIQLRPAVASAGHLRQERLKGEVRMPRRGASSSSRP